MFIRSWLALLPGLLPLVLCGQSTDTLLLAEDAPQVVVTATKLPVQRSQTAQPVLVITREELARQRGSDLAQVLTEQAGILVNAAYANPGQNKSVYIRGAANEFTLLLINGIPLTDPSGIGGAFDLRLLDLNHVERIEILKGSQSTLYGTDAVAGVINIITREGDERGVHPYLDLAYGSLNTFEGGAGLSGRNDRFSYRFGTNYTTTDGISEARPPDTARTSFDEDGLERFSAQADLSFFAGERWTISPFFRYATFDGDFDNGSFLDGTNTFDAEVWSTGARINYAMPGLTSSFNYTLRETDRLFVFPGFDSRFAATSHQVDWFNGFQLAEKVRTTAGLYFDHSQAGIEALEPEVSTVSPYLNLTWQPTSRFTLEGGGRYALHSEFGGFFSYQAVAAFYPVNALRTYASYSTGFKAPNLSQLFGPFGANPDLQPQTSRSLEIGLAWQIAPESMTVELAFFDRKIEDLIEFDFVAGYLNLGEQRDQGVEMTAAAQLRPWLALNANYTYLDGQDLYRRPRHQGLLSLTATGAKLLGRLSLQYVGEREDLYFDAADFTSRIAPLDEYFLLNAHAAYQIPGEFLELYVDLKNLTGTEFTEVFGFSTIGFYGKVGARFTL